MVNADNDDKHGDLDGNSIITKTSASQGRTSWGGGRDPGTSYKGKHREGRMKKLKILSTARFDSSSWAIAMDHIEHFRLSHSALIVNGLTDE